MSMPPFFALKLIVYDCFAPGNPNVAKVNVAEVAETFGSASFPTKQEILGEFRYIAGRQAKVMLLPKKPFSLIVMPVTMA